MGSLALAGAGGAALLSCGPRRAAARATACTDAPATPRNRHAGPLRAPVPV